MRRSILDISGLVVVVAQRTGPLLTRCGKATWISNRARVGTRARARLKQCERASTRPVVHRSSFARRTRSAHRPRVRPPGPLSRIRGPWSEKSRLGRAPLGPSRTMAGGMFRSSMLWALLAMFAVVASAGTFSNCAPTVERDTCHLFCALRSPRSAPPTTPVLARPPPEKMTAPAPTPPPPAPPSQTRWPPTSTRAIRSHPT